MAQGSIQVGDRVINLQVPGIFVVVARRGRLLEIENDLGVRKTVLDVALRRMNEPAPAAS
jgi:hypothetical protein